MHCLAHSAIFLVGCFEGGRVCRQKDVQWRPTRENFTVFEEANVSDPELPGSGGGLPDSVDAHAAWFGALAHPQQVEEGNADKICCGLEDGIFGGSIVLLDVMDERDWHCQLRDGGRIFASEAFYFLTERGNAFALTLEAGTSFSSQFDGRGDGCKGLTNGLNSDFMFVTVSACPDPCSKTGEEDGLGEG